LYILAIKSGLSSGPGFTIKCEKKLSLKVTEIFHSLEVSENFGFTLEKFFTLKEISLLVSEKNQSLIFSFTMIFSINNE